MEYVTLLLTCASSETDIKPAVEMCAKAWTVLRVMEQRVLESSRGTRQRRPVRAVAWSLAADAEATMRIPIFRRCAKSHRCRRTPRNAMTSRTKSFLRDASDGEPRATGEGARKGEARRTSRCEESDCRTTRRHVR